MWIYALIIATSCRGNPNAFPVHLERCNAYLAQYQSEAICNRARDRFWRLPHESYPVFWGWPNPLTVWCEKIAAPFNNG